MSNSNYKLCGKIVGTHGLRGGLKVQNFSDFDRFEPGKTVYYADNGQYIPLLIKDVSDYKQGLLVTFKDYLDINLVEFLVGVNLYALSSAADLKEDEFFYSDLIGKKIYNEAGIERGIVTAVREFPQGHMLIVESNGKKKMIPFRNEFVKKVEAEKIIIHEIEGLL